MTLGTGGPAVSPLGVGTNRWGSGGKGRPDLEPVFHAALEAGIWLFDTAEIYGPGGSERSLGAFLASTRDTSPRPILLSKFFPFPWRLSGRSLRSALKHTLARLGLARLDVYLIHFPWPPVSVDTWVGKLGEAVEEGLIGAAGVSNYSASQMRRAHDVLSRRGIPLACNEVQYSLADRRAERNGVARACQELGATLIAYRPLGSGLLARRGSTPLGSALAGVAAGRGRTAAQVALNWVMGKGALPIPGATSVAHLRENAGALGWSLTPGETAVLEIHSP